jgi:hypothetical protein
LKLRTCITSAVKHRKNINIEFKDKIALLKKDVDIVYRVIHERGISEFLFAAAHYTHCNNILISNFENNNN